MPDQLAGRVVAHADVPPVLVGGDAGRLDRAQLLDRVGGLGLALVAGRVVHHVAGVDEVARPARRAGHGTS